MSKLKEAYSLISQGYALLAEAAVSSVAPAKEEKAPAAAAPAKAGKAVKKKALSLDDIRAKLDAVVEAASVDDAKKIIKKYAPKIAEIDESDYEKVAADVDAFLEKIASGDDAAADSGDSDL